jgi:hypothetical protein
MILFNGQILDTYENTLKGLVVKKSLASINNLSDRKGTASTEFDLPRTARNELIFSNISVEGAQAQVIGDCSILIDNNIYTQGKLYVKGYNDNSYKALFMGAELDLLAELSKKPMREIFKYDVLGTFTDAVIRPLAGAFGTTSNGIRYAYGSPFNDSNEANSELDKYHLAPCFKMVDLVEHILNENGFSVSSNALALPYFDNALISDFKGHKAANTFAGATLTPTGQLNEGNIGNVVLSSNVTRSGNDYILGAAVSKLAISLDIDYNGGVEVEYTQFFIDIIDNTGTPNVAFRTAVFESGGFLQPGNNQFKIEISEPLSSGWIINFRYLVRPLTGFTAPFTGYSLVVNNAVIEAGDADEGDYVYFGNYLPEYSQADFLQRYLKHFNLVLDIIGDEVIIELKDNGIVPNTNAQALQGIASNTVDITDSVRNIKDVSIEYLQASEVLFKQPIIETDTIKYINTLQNQGFGSYLFNLNSFNKKSTQTLEGGFNTIYDDVDEIYSSITFSAVSPSPPTPPYIPPPYRKNEWSNLIFHFTGITILSSYNVLVSRTYQNQVGASSFISTFTAYGGHLRMNSLWDTLFLGTLNSIKDNKIRSINLYDHTGALMDFRNKYIIENQVYKLLEYQYDIKTKAVNAKIQLI